MRTKVCLVIVVLLVWLAGSTSSFAADEPPPPTVTPEGNFGSPETSVPLWTPPRNPNLTENYVVYHPEQGPDVYLPIPEAAPDAPAVAASLAGQPPESVIFSGPGEEPPPSPDLPAQPNSLSALYQVTNPENYPGSMSAMVNVHWPSGATSTCSGALISEQMLLTAGHCVYTFDPSRCIGGAASCWAGTMDVYPGYTGGVYYPEGANDLGIAYSTNKWTFYKWSANQNYSYDIGWVALDRLVGGQTGWFAIGTNIDGYFWNNTLYNPGYPNASPYNNPGLTLWSRDGLLDDVMTEEFGAESTPLYYGMTGAELHNAGYVVYGVESHYHYANSTDFVRLTSEKYTTINTAINNLIPSSVDLAVLDVSLTPTIIGAGSSLSTLDMIIRNYSTASFNGTIMAKTYLSINPTISTSDKEIDSRSISLNLGPRAGVRANFSGMPTIEATTPGGTYYVGTILTVSDANTANNTTSQYDATLLTVCGKPGTAGLTSPAVDSFTADTTPTLDWTSTSDTTRYLIWVDNTPDWSGREVDAYTTNSYYTTGTLAQGKYYWAIRAQNQPTGCSLWGDWSNAWTFTIDATAPNSIVDLIPTPACPTRFLVSWSGYDPTPSSGGLRYNIQYRVNSGSWTNWLTDTSSTSAWFGGGSPITLSIGQRIEFRSQVKDAVGNTESYPSTSDAGVTIGRCVYLPLGRK